MYLFEFEINGFQAQMKEEKKKLDSGRFEENGLFLIKQLLGYLKQAFQATFAVKGVYP